VDLDFRLFSYKKIKNYELMTNTLTNTYFIKIISKVRKYANFQNNNCMRLMTIKIILLGTYTPLHNIII